MDHEIQLLGYLAGQPPPEGPEECGQVGEGVQPLVAVPRERALYPAAVDVEPGDIEAGCGGNEAEGSFHGLALPVDPVHHPLEDACVLAVAGPEEAAFRVAPEPVHAEDLRRIDEARAHAEPVRE